MGDQHSCRSRLFPAAFYPCLAHHTRPFCPHHPGRPVTYNPPADQSKVKLNIISMTVPCMLKVLRPQIFLAIRLALV